MQWTLQEMNLNFWVSPGVIHSSSSQPKQSAGEGGVVVVVTAANLTYNKRLQIIKRTYGKNDGLSNKSFKARGQEEH